jgi:phosphoglycolate phosphatase
MTSAQKHIVFDWNSTLLDDVHALHIATNRLLESEGVKPVTMEFFQDHYDIPFRRLYHNLGLGDDGVRRLIDRQNLDFHDHYETLAATTSLRQGANEILNHATQQGVKSYILSNHLVEPIRTQLRRLQVDHHFSEVLAYENRGKQFRDMTKGEKLRQYRAAEGWPDHQAIIIGDSVEEIEIAREQNMKSVAITGGCVSEQRLRAANPDYVVHDLHQLMPILQQEGFVS